MGKSWASPSGAPSAARLGADSPCNGVRQKGAAEAPRSLPSVERLSVSRSVLEPGRAYEALLPAHQLARYRETAALVDDSEEARISAFRAIVGEVTGGTAGTRSDWVATRDLSRATPDGR